MAQTTLLILGDSSNAAGLSASPEWQELLSDYSIIRGATSDEAQPAIGSTDIACALILDSAAGEEPLDILEAIHLANSNVPVVFCCAKMTSFTAVRLIRAGAAHCFDSRDSIGHLRDALETRSAKSAYRSESCRKQAAHPSRGAPLLLVTVLPWKR